MIVWGWIYVVSCLSLLKLLTVFTKRLNESLNFWNISINSISGGGLARIVNIPSPMSFFFDLRFLYISTIFIMYNSSIVVESLVNYLLRRSSSRDAAAACCSLAMNFSISSKQWFSTITSLSYFSLDVELVSSSTRVGVSESKIHNYYF